MGSFANAVFSLLMGWLKTVTSMIWSSLTAEDGENILQFIGKNWTIIAAVVCICGLIADFTVYLFRWKPYKVWRTFLFRRRNVEVAKEKPATEEEKDLPEIAVQGEAIITEEDDLHRWRDEQTADDSDEEPEVTRAGYIVPADSPYKRPADIEPFFHDEDSQRSNNRTTRRRRHFSSLIGDADEEFHYFTPRPMMDQKEAYHAPVYPERWKQDREQEDETVTGR